MRASAWILAAVLAAPASSYAPLARAQTPPNAADRARARASFQQGVAAYTAGDYNTALAAFQTAYRLAPHPAVRANIANCYMQLRQPVEALVHFDAYLQEHTGVRPEQRAEVERQIEALRGQIAEIRVNVQPPSVRDAIVSVDGHATAIQNVVRMAPGHHVIEASADGYQPERVELDVTAGQRREVALTLRPRVAVSAVAPAQPEPVAPVQPRVEPRVEPQPQPRVEPRAEPQPQPQPERASDPPRVDTPPRDEPGERHGLPPGVFYTGVAVTAVGAVGVAVFGALALGANASFEDAAQRVRSGEPVREDWQDRGYAAAANARTFALVADVSLGVTLVAGVATVIVLTQTNFNQRPVTATPVLSSHGGGFALVGRF